MISVVANLESVVIFIIFHNFVIKSLEVDGICNCSGQIISDFFFFFFESQGGGLEFETFFKKGNYMYTNVIYS